MEKTKFLVALWVSTRKSFEGYSYGTDNVALKGVGLLSCRALVVFLRALSLISYLLSYLLSCCVTISACHYTILVLLAYFLMKVAIHKKKKKKKKIIF